MLLVLVMFAVTGISFTWNISKFVYWITRSSPQKTARLETSWKDGDKLLPLDGYLVGARQAIPGGNAAWIDPPTGRNKLVRVAFRLPNDLQREGAVNNVYLDPGSGIVLRADLLSQAPLGQRVLASFGALHFGEFGIGPVEGVPIKILWCVIGLVPGAMFFTGFLPWCNRVVNRRWARSS